MIVGDSIFIANTRSVGLFSRPRLRRLQRPLGDLRFWALRKLVGQAGVLCNVRIKGGHVFVPGPWAVVSSCGINTEPLDPRLREEWRRHREECASTDYENYSVRPERR